MSTQTQQTARGLGLAAPGSVPAVVGVGLIHAGAVARRSASDRYWA